MKFPLGAMSVGDILDRGLKLLLARLPTLYVINLVVLAPILVMQLAAPLLGDVIGRGLGGAELSPVVVVIVAFAGLMLFLIALLIQPIATAAILHVIAEEFVDRHVGVGEALRFAMGRFLSLLGATLLLGLAVGFGFILCIVPGLFFWVWFVFAPQVVVVEDRTPVDALNRSKELGDGYGWRIFGLLMLFLLIGIAFNLLVGLLGLVLPSQEMVPVDRGNAGFGRGVTPVINYPNFLINTAVSQLVGILVQTYQSVCLTLLYFDLRNRKEGFDLELAAGRGPFEPDADL